MDADNFDPLNPPDLAPMLTLFFPGSRRGRYPAPIVSSSRPARRRPKPPAARPALPVPPSPRPDGDDIESLARWIAALSDYYQTLGAECWRIHTLREKGKAKLKAARAKSRGGNR